MCWGPLDLAVTIALRWLSAPEVTCKAQPEPTAWLLSVPTIENPMSQGILEMVGSMVTLVFAIPLALAGGELLLSGNLPIGIGLLAVALAMIVVDQYVVTPGDLPVLIASKLGGAVAEQPDEE